LNEKQSLEAWSLRLETVRLRDLLAQARQNQVPVKELQSGFWRVRQLAEKKRFAEALARLRELKLELLALLFLHERTRVAESNGIDNPAELDELFEMVDKAIKDSSESEVSVLKRPWLIR
jgi:hypothetical protein